MFVCCNTFLVNIDLVAKLAKRKIAIMTTIHKAKQLCILLFAVAIGPSALAQVITPGQGIDDIQLGTSYEDITWFLGFDGDKMKEQDYQKLDIKESFVQYDYAASYNLILELPVTRIFFKDEKAVMIKVSSIPDYNKIISEDIETSGGLKFWDTLKDLQRVHGERYLQIDNQENGVTHYIFPQKGITFNIQDNQIREITIYQPLRNRSELEKFLRTRN